MHPFREGNGRTQRAFVGQLAAEAGYHLAWEQLTPERNIEASVAAMRGDNAPLRQALGELMSPAAEGRPGPASGELPRARRLRHAGPGHAGAAPRAPRRPGASRASSAKPAAGHNAAGGQARRRYPSQGWQPWRAAGGGDTGPAPGGARHPKEGLMATTTEAPAGVQMIDVERIAHPRQCPRARRRPRRRARRLDQAPRAARPGDRPPRREGLRARRGLSPLRRSQEARADADPRRDPGGCRGARRSRPARTSRRKQLNAYEEAQAVRAMLDRRAHGGRRRAGARLAQGAGDRPRQAAGAARARAADDRRRPPRAVERRAAARDRRRLTGRCSTR